LPGPVTEWKGSSWLLGSLVTDDQLRSLVVGLHVTAGIATIACAVAIGLTGTFPGWWRPLAIIGGLFGLTAFGIFWDGQARLLFDEGAVGAVVSLILLVVATTG
jgi:hypothetical protein